MKHNSSTLSRFLRQYGFKLAVLLVGFFLILFKDLNFQINLRAPDLDSARAQPVLDQPSTARAAPLASGGAKATDGKDDFQRFDLNPLVRRPAPERPPVKRSERPVTISKAEQTAFVKRFAHVAVNEQQKYGLPASLILAHGLLISRAGKSQAAQRGNNFFSLPCTPAWSGERYHPGNQCYRAYENAWTSFRDHSIYLTEGKFAFLSQYEPDDYRSWAQALDRAGFYPRGLGAEQIIQLIEGEKLYRHDRS